MKILRLFLSICLPLSIAAVFSSCKHEDCTTYKYETPSCLCTNELNPVCGCNNQTYSNPCIAECLGIKHFTQGACPK